MPKTLDRDRNGSSLPFRPGGEFAGLSDAEVKAIANEGHQKFTGLRREIKEHARRTGAALNEMKGRIPPRTWTAWLKDNFVGSAETARVYMRIARKWTALADLPDDATIEDMRWVLAQRTSTGPETKRTTRKKAPTDAKPTPPDRPIVPLAYSPEEGEEFDEHMEVLMDRYQTDNVSDTVLEAVRREARHD